MCPCPLCEGPILATAYCIEVPLPPPTLHPNKLPRTAQARGRRDADKAKYRSDCTACILAAVRTEYYLKELVKSCAITYLYRFQNPKAGHHDQDNLIAWAKVALDCLQGHVIENDRGVKALHAIQEKKAKRSGLIINILAFGEKPVMASARATTDE